jgi:small subunit ribosomal protein S8
MSVNHLVSYFIASVNNAGKVGKSHVEFSYSKVIEGMCKVMAEEGFIKSFEIIEVREGIRVIKLELSYFKNAFTIKDFKVVSKPGLRSYSRIKELKPFYDGLGFFILSTNKGIMTDKAAKQVNVGGEVLCKIF